MIQVYEFDGDVPTMTLTLLSLSILPSTVVVSHSESISLYVFPSKRGYFFNHPLPSVPYKIQFPDSLVVINVCR